MTLDWFSNKFEADALTKKSKMGKSVPVIEQLIERIVTGSLLVGDYLPTELELCDEFSVSRTVIREAVQELVRLGLIETGPRVGGKVCPKESWDRFNPYILQALLQHGLDADFYESLIEARALIEPEVAAMAAARAKPHHIKEIKACYEAIEKASSEGACLQAEGRVLADVAFHRAILQACDNWVFQRFDVLFEAAIVARMSLALQSSDNDPPYALEKHKRIVDAIIDRNPGAARKAALSVLALSKASYADYFDSETVG